jgi:hypothetical protein
MKDFVIKDLEHFLDIADTISTPFKFIETSESDVGKDFLHLEAKVWLRSAYVSFTDELKKEDPEKIIENLKRHGFSEAEIRETAFPIK